MDLRIRHDTVYRYRRPVSLQPHRLMLVPRSSPDLRVVASRIDCEPAATVTWAQDVAGNNVATAIFAASTDRLVIALDLVVALTAPEWPVFRIEPHAHAYPFRYSATEMADLGTLCRPDDDAGGILAAWAARHVRAPATDTLSLLKRINADIRDTIAYRARDDEGTQTPGETLSRQIGSCRDLSAVFIGAVRHLGFGARAVSGYLYDPDAAATDPGTTHAWAEVYLPGAGWIAFDPTHGRVGSARLVAVAVGRSIDRLMPVSGGYAGDPDDFAGLHVSVSVTPA